MIESSFTREMVMEFDPTKVSNQLNVGIQVTKSEGKLIVMDIVELIQFNGDQQQAKAVVKMIGVFQKSGDAPLDEDTFAHVNAPAIIYPFVREHIASLFAKGGCGPMLLPPYNFAGRDWKNEAAGQ